MNDQTTSWGVSSAPVDTSELQKFPIVYVGQSEFEEPEVFRKRRNQEILTWLAQKETFTTAQEAERNSRAKVTSILFPTPKKGTQRYDLGGDTKVKLSYALIYTIGDKDLEDDHGNKIAIEHQIRALETKIRETLGEVGVQILKRVIKWKPEVSGSEFEKLDVSNQAEAQVKAAIASVLTIKPGSPTLVFEDGTGG